MISLFPHNEAAYEAAEEMLSETGKAAIIHPTGTGKSFIGFKLCETHADASVCWLSPSSYIFETQIENLKKVTGGYVPENITFFTYAKLMLLSDEEIADIRPDYIIIDEFHRAGAAAWQVGVQKLLTAYPSAPILGLSATNIRYLDNQRDMADELFDGNVASEMTLGEAIVRGILNPPKYVLSVFSYQKDLEKYQRRVRQAKNKAVRDAAEIYLNALRRALDKADGLDEIFAKHMAAPHGKYIAFCANAEHMGEMIKKVPEWFAKVDTKPHIYSAYSDDPATSQAFSDFKADTDDHLKLLFCIDMLNEGVHVDDIDGVILLRPTISPIIYKQQIGRVLSASSKSNAVIFDIVNNFENLYSISAIQEEMQIAVNYYRDLGEADAIINERFRIIDEVRDCKALFDSLNDTLEASWDIMYGYAKTYYEQNGNLNVPKQYKTPDGYSLGTWILTQRRVKSGQIYGHLSEDQIQKLNEIGMIWQSISDMNWERNYAELKEYYDQHGNADVKVDYVTESGIALGKWIVNLRTWHSGKVKTNYLTPERIKLLNDLGMIWDKIDFLFERNYAAAAKYYKTHGSLDIPLDYVCPETRLKLGTWLIRLRRKYQKNPASIPEEQKKRLEAIGMQWEDKYTRQWNEGLQEATAYFQEHGHLNVPYTYRSPNGFALYNWLSNRLDEYRSGRMSTERYEALSAVGMVWEKEDPWQVRYRLAKAYYDENGTLAGMPADYAPDGIWVNKWLNEQKQIYRGKRKGKSLTDEQIQLLDEIGIVWETPTDAAWNRNYDKAKAFHAENGHLQITANDSVPLSVWLRKQRELYAGNKLTDGQIRKLDELGMQWAVDDPWEIGFGHAEEYFRTYQELLSAGQYVCEDGYRLGKWISNQRDKYAKNALTKEQISRLEAIGMVWRLNDELWNRNYQFAKDFRKKYGNLNVPKAYKDKIGFDLNDWFRQQREAYRKGTIPAERKRLLEEISFDWLSPKERMWEDYFISAEKYYSVNGNLKVPVTYRDDAGLWLGRWVVSQRKNKAKLTESQIQQLNDIGMEW